jgi:hypothetical protein
MKVSQLLTFGLSLSLLACERSSAYPVTLNDGREVSVFQSKISPLVVGCGPIYEERNVVKIANVERGISGYVDMNKNWQLDYEDFVLVRGKNHSNPKGYVYCESVGRPNPWARPFVETAVNEFSGLGELVDIALNQDYLTENGSSSL